jgi:alpha-glucosidase (family GH31 glycosyl hydrolase)
MSAVLVLVATHHSRAAEADAQIHFGRAPVELAVSEVSERTVRLELAPLDEQGSVRKGSPSTALVPFPAIEKVRARELTSAKELRVGQLRLTIKPQPLTISVHRTDGKLVQELIFDDNSGTNTVTFRTDAPVLGLGEGEQQFDRRGHYYRMRNGQIAPLLATHGATIPVPFLIGTDGWALFFNRMWGEFDLRETNQGRFIPTLNALGREPLELFIIDVREPADALAEFIRLTGPP